jgi:hypothetical protein
MSGQAVSLLASHCWNTQLGAVLSAHTSVQLAPSPQTMLEQLLPHVYVHVEPPRHCTGHVPLSHVKAHVDAGPHVHCPLFEQAPVQLALLPSQATLHVPLPHLKAQLDPSAHVHVPLFWHVPVHDGLPP